MDFSPFLRQLFVASAPQLASLSVGGIFAFPGVLFQQLRANDSTIQLDVDAKSWIGSTHGLASAVACLMPLFMQYKGRKLCFIINCLIGLIGWIIIYFAQSPIALIVAECFHGLSAASIITCSLNTISEMVKPSFRIISMNMFVLGQVIGMNIIMLTGRYASWRTVALMECCPLTIALLISFTWPESPAWLAYKGMFDKCEEAFKWLRGTDVDSDRELRKLIQSQKEIIAQRKSARPVKNSCGIWLTITQKQFYLPCLHSFVLFYVIYWSGYSVVLVYTMDMLHQVTSSESVASTGVIIIYMIVLLGNTVGVVILNFCKNKTIILAGGTCAGFFMFAASIMSYLQVFKILSQDSFLCMYCLIGYTISFTFGTVTSIPSVAIELMPIKYRGIGVTVCTIMISLLDFSALKLSPYLFLYIKPSNTFLIFAINAVLCMLFIWRYVPETKNRSLQEIEDFYKYGHFVKDSMNDDVLEKIQTDHNNAE